MHLLHFVEAAHGEASADQQHERKRNLANDQRVAHAALASPGACSSAAFFEARGEVSAREKRGERPKNNTGAESNNQRKQQNAAIDMNFSSARSEPTHKIGQQLQTAIGHEQPECTASQSHQKTFRQELPQE